MSQYKWKWCTDGPAQKQQKCRDIYKGGEKKSSLKSVNIPEKSSARSTNQGFDVANTPTRDSTGSAGRSRDGRHCIWKTVGSPHWAFPRSHNTQKPTRWHGPFYSLYATSSKGPSTVPGHRETLRREEPWWVLALTPGKSRARVPPAWAQGRPQPLVPLAKQQLKDTWIKAGGVLHGAKQVAFWGPPASPGAAIMHGISFSSLSQVAPSGQAAQFTAWPWGWALCANHTSPHPSSPHL